MTLRDPFAALAGFEWDEGNSEKNWRAHAVTRAEAEEAFGNAPVVVAEDVRHSRERSFARFPSECGNYNYSSSSSCLGALVGWQPSAVSRPPRAARAPGGAYSKG